MHEYARPPFSFLQNQTFLKFVWQASKCLSILKPLLLSASLPPHSHSKVSLTSLLLSPLRNSLWVQFHNPLLSSISHQIHQISFCNSLSQCFPFFQFYFLSAMILQHFLNSGPNIPILIYTSHLTYLLFFHNSLEFRL